MHDKNSRQFQQHAYPCHKLLVARSLMSERRPYQRADNINDYYRVFQLLIYAYIKYSCFQETVQ
ncbi:MAG: hypothetical protein ACXWTK_06650 [Methylobacter sp.]